MSELQSTIEFSVELYKFHNIDLFQRGLYQVRCCLRVSSKSVVEVEIATPEVTTGLGRAQVLDKFGACRPFQILYRNEEVTLKDVILFRCRMLADASTLRESLEKAEFFLLLELWFNDTSVSQMALISSRTLQLELSPIEGLHYHLPVIFDYFHLSAVSVTIHAALIALDQSATSTPRSSKSWSKSRRAVPQSPKIHVEAYNVLLEANKNLKTIIDEFNSILIQKEEKVLDDYDTLIVKHGDYDNTQLLKKCPTSTSTPTLAQTSSENMKLWNYFLLSFSCRTAIQQFLSKKHHQLRVKRFAEFFFFVQNPRKSAIACYEMNHQRNLVVAKLARRSKYMQLLPPLPVHCGILDGDNATMPIIFEDQYQNPFDSENRNGDQISQVLTESLNFKRSTTVENATSCSCGTENISTRNPQPEKSLNSRILEEHSTSARHSKSLDHLQVGPEINFHNSMSDILHYKGRHERESKTNVYNAETFKNVTNSFYIEENVFGEKSSLIRLRKGNGLEYYLRNSEAIELKKVEKTSPQEKFLNKEPSPKLQKFNFSPSHNQIKYTNGLQNDISKIKTFGVGSTSSSTDSIPKTHGTAGSSLASKYSKNSQSSVRRVTSACNIAEEFNILIHSSGAESLPNMGLLEEKSTVRRWCSSSSNSEESGWISSSSSSIVSSTEEINFATSSIGSNQDIPHKKLWSCKADQRSKNNTNDKIFDIICTVSEKSKKDLPEISLFSHTTQQMKDDVNSFKDCNLEQSFDDNFLAVPPPKQFRDLELPSGSVAKKLVNFEDSGEDFFQKLSNKKDSRNKDILSSRKIYKKYSRNSFLEKSDELEDPSFENTVMKNHNEANVMNCSEMSTSNAVLSSEDPSWNINDEFDDSHDNAFDNLLYHVIDTQTKLECQFNSRHCLEHGLREARKSFQRAKKEFKSQLNYHGVLYSDLNYFASNVPYFSIADEFRIFSPEGMHLIICVHGLDGNSADLRLIKTYLELGLPGAYLDFLMSETNQGDTFSDFETMTDKLVSEISSHLDSSIIRPTRISFVGHSLGNIIIRSALTRPQMKFLLPRLHTYLSLSGPHLGTLYNSSDLVNMGMWFMQKLKRSGSLLQLCLKDSVDPKQTFLYRLSQRSNMHNFKNVLLCGSGQDRYVPLHSARIELCKSSLKDTTEQGIIYRKMVHNLLQPVITKKGLKLLRYDIHHALPNTANSLIGRAAHIASLDSEIFIEKFMVVVGLKYFR